MHEIQMSEIQMPDIRVSEIQMPDIQVSEIQMSDIQMSEIQTFVCSIFKQTRCLQSRQNCLTSEHFCPDFRHILTKSV